MPSNRRVSRFSHTGVSSQLYSSADITTFPTALLHRWGNAPQVESGQCKTIGCIAVGPPKATSVYSLTGGPSALCRTERCMLGEEDMHRNLDESAKQCFPISSIQQK